MKFITIFLLSLVCISSFANSNRTQSKLKQKHHHTTKNQFTLEFLIASEQIKEIYTKEMDGTYTKIDASLLQRVTQNDELRYFLSTRYVDSISSTEGNELEVFFAEFMYRRKNILTESNNGIYAELELKKYQIIDEDIKEDYLYDGAFIPQLILKKKVGSQTSIKMKLRRHIYQVNSQENFALHTEDRVYLSAYTVFKHRYMFGAQLKYQHKIRNGSGWNYKYGDHFGELIETHYNPATREFSMDDSRVPRAKKHQEILTLHVGPSYFINRKSMIEVYAETKLGDSYDERDLKTIMSEELVLGAALYLTAF